MDKITEVVGLGVAGVFAAVSGWIVRNLHSSSEKTATRVSLLEQTLVDRPYMETQLAPIRQDLNLILSHLLEHRKTEGSPAEASPVKPIRKSS